jgi:hypothetical protein
MVRLLDAVLDRAERQLFHLDMRVVVLVKLNASIQLVGCLPIEKRVLIYQIGEFDRHGNQQTRIGQMVSL